MISGMRSLPYNASGVIPPVTECIDMDERTQEQLDAAAFRRLLAHLDQRRDLQNIELMNLAGFCRNCLSRWYREAAEQRGLAVDDAQARERVYGMPYAEWKARYQTPSEPGERA